MGMDVFGNNGNYFRRNVWNWRPVADLCCDLAPEITAACEHWHTNDGDGLDQDDAMALADALDGAIDDGDVADYVAARDSRLAALPNETCGLCRGGGIRGDDIGVRLGMPARVIDAAGHPRHGETGWCNGCDGVGHTPPFAANYRRTIEDVREFAEFLRNSGGFQIC